MQTALHIHALVEELRKETIGATIIGAEHYRKERTAILVLRKDKSTLALGFVYHPAGSGCFLVPARKARPDTREMPRPFFDIEGAHIVGIQLPRLDRLFSIQVVLNGKPKNIMIEAIGPNGNLWLLDNDLGVERSLRKKEVAPGTLYMPPEPPPGVNPFTLLPDQMVAVRRSRPGVGLLTQVERGVWGFDRSLAREALVRADLDFADPDDLGADDVESLRKRIREIAGFFNRTDTGYLYVINGRFAAYPLKLSSRSEPPEKVKSLSLAVLETVRRNQDYREEQTEQQQVLQAVARAIKRIEKRISKLEKDLTEASDFERSKTDGELLQIHRDMLSRGMQSVTVDDSYNPGQTRTIKLDPALTQQENIERCFQKYRKGRDGLSQIQRRLEISRAELTELRIMAKELESDFDSARQGFEADLAGLLPKEAGKRETLPRLPYREHTLSTGLRIFVGKDGADNDRTTFEFSKPYELWFHAQQCPGSHVVMKYPNRQFEPSAQEIAETAAVAAWHSKARNDSLVPVVYTERKYVRKPRKAKPGLVTVEREKSVMVVPQQPG